MPGSRTRAPTETTGAPPSRRAGGGAGRSASAVARPSTAMSKPMPNRFSVGGIVDAPPRHPTISGPSPCPVETATM